MIVAIILPDDAPVLPQAHWFIYISDYLQALQEWCNKIKEEYHVTF